MLRELEVKAGPAACSPFPSALVRRLRGGRRRGPPVLGAFLTVRFMPSEVFLCVIYDVDFYFCQYLKIFWFVDIHESCLLRLFCLVLLCMFAIFLFSSCQDARIAAQELTVHNPWGHAITVEPAVRSEGERALGRGLHATLNRWT